MIVLSLSLILKVFWIRKKLKQNLLKQLPL